MEADPGSNAVDDNAGVKIPPPIVFFLFLGLGFGFEYLSPLTLIPYTIYIYILIPTGILLVVIGLYFGLGANLIFRRVGTEVRPWKPVTTIVSTGPFRFTRNPMYLGLTMAQVGIGTLANSPWVMLMAVPFVTFIRFYAIPKEERYLERKFGGEYLAYKEKVRRWL